MRQAFFIIALLATVVLETSVSLALYWGVLVALLINFLFSRRQSYWFLAAQVFLVAMLRLDPWLGGLVIGDLLLLKLVELLTFHFSHSRDSWLRYLVGLVIMVTGHFILLFVPFWHNWEVLFPQLLLNLLVGFAIWLLIRPWQRWLSPPPFAILAK